MPLTLRLTQLVTLTDSEDVTDAVVLSETVLHADDDDDKDTDVLADTDAVLLPVTLALVHTESLRELVGDALPTGDGVDRPVNDEDALLDNELV